MFLHLIGLSPKKHFIKHITLSTYGRFQWPRVLTNGSAAARLLGSWVRIPPGTSLVSVAFVQVEASDSVSPLVQKNSKECAVFECNREDSIMSRP